MCLSVRQSYAGKINFSCAIAYPLGRRLWQSNENKYRHCQHKNVPRAGCEQEELGPGQQDYIHVDSYSPLNQHSFKKLAQHWGLATWLGELRDHVSSLSIWLWGHTAHQEDVYWRSHWGMVIQGLRTAIKTLLSCPAFPFSGCSLAKQLNILKSNLLLVFLCTG